MVKLTSLGRMTLPLLHFALVANAAIGPVANLHIANQVLAPDGFNRSVIAAGGQVPGPLIKGNKGDTFQINVFNDLTDPTMFKSTSIHWHGLLQHGTTWADGAAFVSQCPIAPSNSFTYKFSAANQAGTYWYHSHLSTQYCDGLKGPLVIYDPSDPNKHLYDVDDESTVISLTEWYHLPTPQLPLAPSADSTLINGLGRFSGGPASNLAVIAVQRGKRYRFRLISMACEPNFIFSIDNHPLTVIEADGVSTQPVTVDEVQVFTAQRYSFVLNANQAVGNYWIRALPNLGSTTFDGGLNSAILRYVGAPAQDPNTTANASPVLLQETSLHPLVSSPVPGNPFIGGADVNLQLNFTFNAGKFAVNGVSFVSPSVPVLLQILHGSRTAQDLLPAGSVYTLPHDQVIEIQMPGGVVDGGHPLHLHGHTFWVVRSAGSTTTNFLNPVIRDTVNIGGAGDDVTIRFRTDNPGPWFLHCHIDFHLNAGFAVVFAEDVNRTALANPIPSAWNNLCPLYDALPPGNQ